MVIVGNDKKIIVLLAIALFFSTVSPVQVLAGDVEFITNVVYTSQTTGGVSKDGKDGADGEDGKDGKDGQPGKNGGSVVTVDSTSSASVHVESMQGNTTVVDFKASSSQSSTSAYTATTSTDTSVGSFDSTDTDTSVLFALQEALFSFRLMLVKYVSQLF